MRSLKKGLNDVSVPVTDICHVAKCSLTVAVMWPRLGPLPPPSEPQPYPPLAPGYHLAAPRNEDDYSDDSSELLPVEAVPGSVSKAGAVRTLAVALSVPDGPNPSGEDVTGKLSVQSCKVATGTCSDAMADVRVFVYAVDASWLEAEARAQWNIGLDRTLSRGESSSAGVTDAQVTSSLESLLSAEHARAWLQVCVNL